MVGEKNYQKERRRFSILRKLGFFFGTLILIGGFTMGASLLVAKNALIDASGKTIADKDIELVKKQENSIKNAISDPELKSIADFEQKVLASSEAGLDRFVYKGEEEIAAYSPMKTKNWKVIISAPVHELTGSLRPLKITIRVIGISILIVSIILTAIIALSIVKPITSTVQALKNIADGDGDLRVRLPIKRNDEIADLSKYFNKTIEKIGNSIKTVGSGTQEMEQIGNELASNMTETASAIHQISTNIEGVKQQALTQAASMNEMAAGAFQINEATQEVNTITQKNKENIGNLVNEVEKFKI